MEKFIKNNVLRLPPGFRFHPTDEELVVHYLKRKVESCPLPASIIPEVDVCKFDPWDLPGFSEHERFFFTIKETKYPNGNRSNRATQSGYWKATGLDKQIVGSRTTQLVVGMKKTLVFYHGKPPSGSRTDWIMHEYRLSTQSKNSTKDLEKWVLCRIFLKKRKGNSPKEEEKDSIKNAKPKPTFYDFLATPKIKTGDLNLAPTSSSGSSGITDAGAYGHRYKHENEHEHDENSNHVSTVRNKQWP